MISYIRIALIITGICFTIGCQQGDEIPPSVEPADASPRTSDNSSMATDPQARIAATIAEGYAKRYGVSTDEALLRLDLQNSFPDLESQLESNEAATFAGLWIQHEPEYKIVVAFTRNGDETIKKYSSSIPPKVAPYIEVRTAGKSLAGLLDDQAALVSSLNRQGIRADSRVDVKNNCVSIDIAKEDEARFKAAEQSGELEIPEGTKINVVEGLAPY